MTVDTRPAPPGSDALARSPGQSTVRKRLGSMLVDEGVLDERQLAYALSNPVVVDGRRERLGQTVVRLGFVSEQAVARALAHQLGLEYVEDQMLVVDDAVAGLVSRAMAERHRILPLRREEDILVVACTDPTDVVALDDVRLASGSRRVRAVVSTPSALTAAVRRAYGFEGQSTDLLEAIAMQAEEDEPEEDLTIAAEDGPVVRLAEGIIAEALRSGTSDIHVEPGAAETVVRYRIDGVLKQVMSVPRSRAGALVSRLKLMAGMDIAERRRPQDGRVGFRTGSQEVDLRCSTLPSLHGETIVMRLLRTGSERLSIGDLGFTDGDLASVLSAVERPQGLVLLTGPTGSGKTSTLYGFLGHLAGEDRNVITLEDPVEYQLAGVNQTQINDRIGFTFARALRTVLRQDPDIVMVGEIRDPETAELAMQASLTGHLVFSTLHTNSASGAVVRLRDLDVPSYLVASSLTLVIAQRLVRTVCEHCAVTVAASEKLLARLHLTAADMADARLCVGSGCPACNQSGYRGRIGVFEVIVVDGPMRELLSANASESRVRQAARLSGMRTLREDALRLARTGRTTLEEVLRVTPSDLGEGGSCPVCSQQVEPEFALCPWCGVHLRPDACTECEQPLQRGWKLCPRCGTDVPDAPVSAPRLPSVLVTDDDVGVQDAVAAMLEGRYEVLRASDGREALEAVRSHRPDAVLLDIGPPDVDGYEIVAALRARPATADIPVVLMTADQEWVTQQQRRSGADDLVAKPFTSKQLHDLLGRALSHKAA